MTEIYDFSSPRNLFEKLLRDSEKINRNFNSDNLLNFIFTAYHLSTWIHNSNLIKIELVKRFLKRISKDPLIKLCKRVVYGETQFSLKLETETESKVLIAEDKEIDGEAFVHDIVELYSIYFKIKGH